jgi:hypothetical protein
LRTVDGYIEVRSRSGRVAMRGHNKWDGTRRVQDLRSCAAQDEHVACVRGTVVTYPATARWRRLRAHAAELIAWAERIERTLRRSGT